MLTSYSVGIITDYVNFHTFENVRITLYLSEKWDFDLETKTRDECQKLPLYTKNQLWVLSSFFNQFVHTNKNIYIDR